MSEEIYLTNSQAAQRGLRRVGLNQPGSLERIGTYYVYIGSPNGRHTLMEAFEVLEDTEEGSRLREVEPGSKLFKKLDMQHGSRINPMKV
jgi:hypothetical protein